jgi:hypothetical protein
MQLFFYSLNLTRKNENEKNLLCAFADRSGFDAQ